MLVKQSATRSSRTGYSGRLKSIYPDGIPIGRVTYVTRTTTWAQPNKQIQVTPFVNFDNLSGVVVLEMQLVLLDYPQGARRACSC